MATIIHDPVDGRVLFTEEMKDEYTILMPQMLPIHFTFLKNILTSYGYKVELLTTTHPGIVTEGLQDVHNDTCYPALLVIGQLLDAVKSGKYDPDKIALIITQTGGGCRASNYIHLLRKALKRNNLEQIPVVSFNLNGFEKNPGFQLDAKMIHKMIYTVVYGDLMMWLSNQTRPYEIEEGATSALVDAWIERLSVEIMDGTALKSKHVKRILREIVDSFAALEMDRRIPKIKVGVVGEIYVKYAPLGNNNLEDFLASENAEVVVPGLLDFLLYAVDTQIADNFLNGKKFRKSLFSLWFRHMLLQKQAKMIKAVKKHSEFALPNSFWNTLRLIKGYVSRNNTMGEGWLLTGEMLELIHAGVNNIVCAQPFGCLPNHVVGKGMIRRIRENNPGSNIVAIDYDPGATKINQENRIKLMLAVARQRAGIDIYVPETVTPQLTQPVQPSQPAAQAHAQAV